MPIVFLKHFKIFGKEHTSCFTFWILLNSFILLLLSSKGENGFLATLFCSFAFVKGLEHEFLKQSSSLSYKRFVDDSKDQFLFGLPFHHHYHIILIIILEIFSYILFLVVFWKRLLVFMSFKEEF